LTPKGTIDSGEEEARAFDAKKKDWYCLSSRYFWRKARKKVSCIRKKGEFGTEKRRGKTELSDTSVASDIGARGGGERGP